MRTTPVGMRALGAAVVAALAIAPAAARAQAGDYGQPELERPRLSALRLQVGGASVSRGVYCAYGYYTTSCSSLEYPYTPLNFVAEYEAGIAPGFGVALGFHWLTGPYLDRDVQVWEPTADLVFRVGSYRAGSSFRLRIGAGYWRGESGRDGWTGRGGMGLTIRGRSRWGLALDAAWEYGDFEGKAASVVHYVIGPELAL